MSAYTFNPHSLRIDKARLARTINPGIDLLLLVASGLLIGFGIALVLFGRHQGLSLIGPGLGCNVIYLWIKRDLRNLPAAPIGSTTELSQLLPSGIVGYFSPGLTPAQLWAILETTSDAAFLVGRFGLDINAVRGAMAGWQANVDQIWDESAALSAKLGQATMFPAAVASTMFRLNPALDHLLTQNKLTPDDLDEGAHWYAGLVALTHIKSPIYGGIARDWASGYTPQLARYGTNLSTTIEFSGGKLSTQERTTQIDALITALNSANGSVVLVGEPGVGKSALLLGLAEYLLQGKESRGLSHYQIYTLNASMILSNTEHAGDIERIVLELFTEAIHARNIIIALDEAQLFFGQGTGAVNLSQVMLPVLQSRNLKVVLAVAPGDWQKLKATNGGMASLLTPLMLTEADQLETMRVLAERALLLEGRLTTTYNALLEAYRLSGRYLQDEAYPGRALKVLEASLNYPDGAYITERSVQKAIESQFGVKVQQATAAESDVLLNLEEKIHQRMINQTRAVSVVSNALRRARAGVANPKRPIGSFLFLGPTGVGKTELAKSLAALYFGSEHSVIRLDMSEYQQVSDVDRILQSAAENPEALLPRVKQAPFSVVLFDEVEKAHPNVLNLFLQLLDEGNLTDTTGHPASFKDAIVIATSNAGAEEIRRHIEAGEQLESFEEQFTNDLISSGAFKPELLNRFDEIVLFRPLNQAELGQVVRLMLTEVNSTLANQKISVELSDDAVTTLVNEGYDPRLGARPMRRMVQRRVEDAVAGMILRAEAQPGDVITLDSAHLAPLSTNEASASEPTPPADADVGPKPPTNPTAGPQAPAGPSAAPPPASRL